MARAREHLSLRHARRSHHARLHRCSRSTGRSRYSRCSRCAAPPASPRSPTELGVHKSTVFRLLATLEARGLVEQHSERGRYRLGYGVVQLAEGATKMDDLSLLSRPVCRQLAETVRETVNLVVHDGRAVISIAQVLGAPTITTVNWVGQRTPMHATSAGQGVHGAHGARATGRPPRGGAGELHAAHHRRPGRAQGASSRSSGSAATPRRWRSRRSGWPPSRRRSAPWTAT